MTRWEGCGAWKRDFASWSPACGGPISRRRSGRRSFGSRTKRLIETWLQSRTDAQLVRGSFGQDPSNVGGYGTNWNEGYRDARGWTTTGGHPNADMVGMTFHHAFSELVDGS